MTMAMETVMVSPTKIKQQSEIVATATGMAMMTKIAKMTAGGGSNGGSDGDGGGDKDNNLHHHVDQEKVLIQLKCIWREANPA